MAWLFDTSAQHWAHASANKHRWRGLSLYSIDGTTLRVWDSEENREHFGLPSGGPRGDAAYPQVRLVALAALRSHLPAAVSFGPYTTGEATYAKCLWPQIPDHSLCILDRNFLAANMLIPLGRDGSERNWFIRAKKNTKWRELRRLGEDDYLVEMTVSRYSRRKDPALPKVWIARAIRYRLDDGKPKWLLTSLFDNHAYPRREILDIYHERWEIELGFDEIKTEILEREEAIRSRNPERVRQEIWEILLAFNLVRLEMEQVAEEAEVEPTRISFITSLHFICEEWMWSASASPGAIPRQLRKLRADLRRFIPPPRRPRRRYPRAVKIKMSSYPRKRRPEQEPPK